MMMFNRYKRCRVNWFVVILFSVAGVIGVAGVASAQLDLRVSEPTDAALNQTLDRLAAARADGQSEAAKIVLPEGVYRLRKPIQLTPALVGRGLTIIADKDAHVVLSGGQRLESAGKDEQGHWRFSLPDDWQPDAPRSAVMVIDGVMRDAARYPNDRWLRIDSALADRRSGLIAKPGDIPASLLKDYQSGDCQLVLLHDWSSSRMPIASIDAATHTLRTLGPIGCAADHYKIDHFEKQPRYRLVGHRSFVDSVGEWAIDDSARQVIVASTQGQSSPPEVVLPRVAELLIARGDPSAPISNVTIQDITFCESALFLSPGGLAGSQATMHEVRNAQGQRTSGSRVMLGAAIQIEHAQAFRFNHCQFNAIGGTGLQVGARTQNCRVFRCKFDNIAGNGLNLGEDTVRRVDGKVWYAAQPDQVATGNVVDQCQISRCGEILPGAVAVWGGINKQLQLTNNHIHDCPYTGISLGWVWNDTPTPAADNVIRGNHIEFVMQTLSDGGGIYTLGRQEGSVIEGNRISDVPLNAGRAESNGMFLDEGSTGFTIRDNTIRRIDRSPIRFHKAGKNVVQNNRWELATDQTPPVRFNNTPEANITIQDNEVVAAQKSVFLIGNSLTWDTVPPQLDGHVHWHVDCGKSLAYIFANPSSPCVGSSRLWPIAFQTMQYDIVCVQPHYGTTIDQDVQTIQKWVALQTKAEFVIHTGWAKHEQLAQEAADQSPVAAMTHNVAYFDALLDRLRAQHPGRVFRRTRAMDHLMQIARDIPAGTAPLKSLDEIYRDAIHMTIPGGRYLMHNTMRQSLGQPHSDAGFSEVPPQLKTYLDQLLNEAQSNAPPAP